MTEDEEDPSCRVFEVFEDSDREYKKNNRTITNRTAVG